MSVLLSLPDEFCQCFLSEWLYVASWGFLDTAVCSKLWRRHCLRALSKSRGEFNIYGWTCTDNNPSLSFFKWVNARVIKLREIVLERNYPFRVYQTIARIWWDEVITLRVEDGPRDCTEFANSCSELKTLICSSNIDFSKLKPDVLKQLVHLEYDGKDSISVLKIVGRCCRQLKTFKVSNQDEDNSLVIEIFRRNDLETVNINVNDELLKGLVEHCSNSLKILHMFNDDMHSVPYLVCNCPLLTDLHFSGVLEGSWHRTTSSLIIRYAMRPGTTESIENDLMLQGWDELMEAFPDLLRVQWEDAVCELTLKKLINRHSLTLQAVCFPLPLDWTLSNGCVPYILKRCPMLKSFEYSSRTANINWAAKIDWAEPPVGNHLEKLSVPADFTAILLILKRCPFLTELSIEDPPISLLNLRHLIPVVRDYKNILGVPFQFRCDPIYIDDEEDCEKYSKTWGLVYDSKEFSGEKWDQLKKSETPASSSSSKATVRKSKD